MARKWMSLVLNLLVCVVMLAPCGVEAKNDKNKQVPPGQAMDKGTGPPDHAPAHGYRRKYRYYPNNNVYFDETANVYHYYYNNQWQSGPEIPKSVLSIDLGDFVNIELETEFPWEFNSDHQKTYGPPHQ